MIEFERTFLVKKLPSELKGSRCEHIDTKYFPADARHPVLRLRKKGVFFELTKKVPTKDSSECDEQTILLEEAEFRALWAVPGKELKKSRYHLSAGGKDIEIDVYHGALQGLVTADVEFADGIEKERFIPPEFFGVEVTHEEFVAGGFLAGRSYADIEPFLKEKGYAKVMA